MFLCVEAGRVQGDPLSHGRALLFSGQARRVIVGEEQAGGGARQVVTSAQLVGAVPSAFAKIVVEELVTPSNAVEYKNLLLSLNAMIMFLDFVLYQIPLQYNIYHKENNQF